MPSARIASPPTAAELRALFVAALVSAGLVALIGLPLSSWRGTLVVALLTLPATGLSVLLAGAALRVGRLPAWLLPLLVPVALLALLFAGGIYVSNLIFVDAPFGHYAKLGYLASLALALGAALYSRRLGAPVARLAARHRPLRVVGGLLVINALFAALLDSYGIRPEYPVHGLLLALTIGGLAVGTLYLLPSASRRMALLAALGLTLAGAAAGTSSVDYAALAAAPGAHGHILALARQLTDRDHDGFSAYLGGGDCDDGDRNAYPLSPIRDCLGWRGHAEPPLPALVSGGRRRSAPRVVLLLTIDAFRCGFGRGEAEPLRSACPNLSRIADEGWARLDAHSAVPNTSPSMTVLMTGNPNADPLPHRRQRPTLPERLGESGYRTEVLVTFPHIVSDLALRSAFDEVNYELFSRANSPFIGERVTARVLERTRSALAAGDQRLFLWAHYPDPHYPFMVDDSPFKHGSVEAYAKIVARTDATIGELLGALGREPHGDELLVLVTADHGEEFGEHGERYHGFTLYEPDVRVPIIAWSPGQPRRYFDRPPPAVTADFGNYLLGAINDNVEAPPTSSDVLLRTVMGDRQYGVIAGGWKLIYNASRNTTYLFHLEGDPDERVNLAEAAPARVAELGGRLGHLLAPSPYVRQGRRPR